MKFALALSAVAVAAALEARFVGLQANPTHYGDPTTGCMSDEMNVTVTGLTGDFCSPPCDASQNCPTDVPTGCKAVGQCVLDVNGGANPTYCALICDPATKGVCGKAPAKCEPIQGTGVCTYPIGK